MLIASAVRQSEASCKKQSAGKKEHVTPTEMSRKSFAASKHFFELP